MKASRLFRLLRYNKLMVEDESKVSAYLDNLNANLAEKPWRAADGFQIWPEFIFGLGGKQNNIEVGRGLIVKVFFNNQTGEVKTVVAAAMVKNG